MINFIDVFYKMIDIWLLDLGIWIVLVRILLGKYSEVLRGVYLNWGYNYNNDGLVGMIWEKIVLGYLK